jgi:hypothetical protein
MIVNCCNDAVDLTTRKLSENERPEETVIERKGDFCDGRPVDEEFLKFVGRKVGHSTIDLVRKKYYNQ